jgi:hypothetical protein
VVCFLEDSFLSSIDAIPGGGVTVGGLDDSWALVRREYPPPTKIINNAESETGELSQGKSCDLLMMAIDKGRIIKTLRNNCLEKFPLVKRFGVISGIWIYKNREI